MEDNRLLTLRLSKPIEELIPQMITFNKAELMECVRERLTHYQGKVYDEDSISEAKTDRAALNKFSEKLNAARLQLKKIYTAPLEKFTGEVNEVIAEVNKVIAEIGVQIKDYEKQREEAKLAEIKEYYVEKIGSLGEFVPYEKVHKSQWLNVSKSMASIKKEIEATIEQIRSDLASIEALQSEDEITLKSFYFRTLRLADAITHNEMLKAEKKRIAEAQAKAKEAVTAPVAEQKVEEAVAKAVEEEEEDTIYTVTFAVTGTAEKLARLALFLKDNKYNFKKA